ncbi:hypothetical protein AA12467_0393 [Gluconobacter sphaericus NBRC 12467]|nr:hypothetical protein AA12467_0393 [Gluconobacter sphaericus NBRC 12467]
MVAPLLKTILSRGDRLFRVRTPLAALFVTVRVLYAEESAGDAPNVTAALSVPTVRAPPSAMVIALPVNVPRTVKLADSTARAPSLVTLPSIVR